LKLEDMIMVSVDDHIVEPPTMFDNHLTVEQKAFAPRMERDEEGKDFWIYEGMRLPQVGLNAVAGRVPEEFGCEPSSLDQMRLATYDVNARVDDMNVNGILGSMNFGSFVGFEGATFLGVKDKNRALTVLQAYNDWHIDEWCGSHPGRFIPLAILPLWDVQAMVAEVKRVRAKGCHAVSFSDNPSAKGLPSIHLDYWEPFWAACADNEMVICNHIGTGNAPPHPSMESPIDAWIIGMPISISISAADWLHLAALQRHPNLKIALSEGGVGWIPYFLERADFTYGHHKAWTNADFGSKLPSEVFHEHFYTCFIDDKFGVHNRHAVGIDTMMYECDYPHSDSLWPHAPEALFESMKNVPDAEVDKMTHLNAMKAFYFDPFSILGRENCTVGALRAKATHVDVSLKSYNGPRPIEIGEKRRVTSGDISKMFADFG
jgi:predicted TIM-barrel fold metal-dependent hydrolase